MATLKYPSTPASSLQELDTNVRSLVPQLERKILTDISVGTGETAVAHGCSSPPRFFSVCPQADARVWRSTASDSRCLYLTASAAVTVDIEVVP